MAIASTGWPADAETRLTHTEQSDRQRPRVGRDTETDQGVPSLPRLVDASELGSGKLPSSPSLLVLQALGGRDRLQQQEATHLRPVFHFIFIMQHS